MLQKIANVACLLDEAGFYSEADKLTMILERYAQRVAGILDEDEDDDPSDDYHFFGKRWNDRPEIDASDPDFQAEFRDKNPIGYQAYDAFQQGLTGRGKPSTQWMHGVPIQFGPGFSKYSPRDTAEFLYPHEELMKNQQEIQDRFNRRTRNQKHRGTFELDYASGQGPSEDEPIEDFRARSRAPRKMVFDPHLYEKYLSEQGRSMGENTLPMFDAKVYEPLFNPTHPDFNSEEPIISGRHSPVELRQKVQDGSLGLGGLAGYGARPLNPGQTFGFQTFKRPMDDITGKKRPNFYVPNKGF